MPTFSTSTTSISTCFYYYSSSLATVPTVLVFLIIYLPYFSHPSPLLFLLMVHQPFRFSNDSSLYLADLYHCWINNKIWDFLTLHKLLDICMTVDSVPWQLRRLRWSPLLSARRRLCWCPLPPACSPPSRDSSRVPCLDPCQPQSPAKYCTVVTSHQVLSYCQF